MTILIAGGGIAGLSLGLTLHEIGVPFQIFEATKQIKPLGVGINLQPNAVRELFDLGLETDLDRIGVRTRQYGFYSKLGKTIWEEPRGTLAGYEWPQYSVHRGHLQMLLYQTLLDRAGPDCVVTGARATGFEINGDQVSLCFDDGRQSQGKLLIGADGIHSALRAQMYPGEGDPIWNGRVLWRATTKASAYFGGAAMVMIGHNDLRLVAYPISDVDETGQAVINWIAEKRFPLDADWKKEDWNRAADVSEFLPDFTGWEFDWINVPSLIKGADIVFEYPMVDRDPLPQWTKGPVTLMGDAAHPTYPVGSNGASQAIIDARVIGASLLTHGITPAALQAFETDIRPVTTGICQANRSGNGPDGVLQRVEDLCGGDFERIEDIIPYSDLSGHAEKYKSLSGFSIEALNARSRTIPSGAQVANP